MIMANEGEKGRIPSSEAAEKERLLKHEEAAKALGKPNPDDLKIHSSTLSSHDSFIRFYSKLALAYAKELSLLVSKERVIDGLASWWLLLAFVTTQDAS
ncbi:unnamed protein product [Gongylonema pulchrum]|uniref:DUF3452 domain-containing protein n=1 Tax=Gongylonema pulchrum TaxID=637853 RepID=A0A183DB80_9BILA|nr:unnamed protein product [Gongylonema pulchrum]